MQLYGFSDFFVRIKNKLLTRLLFFNSKHSHNAGSQPFRLFPPCYAVVCVVVNRVAMARWARLGQEMPRVPWVVRAVVAAACRLTALQRRNQGVLAQTRGLVHWERGQERRSPTQTRFRSCQFHCRLDIARCTVCSRSNRSLRFCRQCRCVTVVALRSCALPLLMMSPPVATATTSSVSITDN